MKTARLIVAWELAGDFDACTFPDGYDAIWERPFFDEFGERAVEYLIAGPFPEVFEDGGRVEALLTRHGPALIGWQWLDENSNPLGPEAIVAIR